jgi:hypothetical protein
VKSKFTDLIERQPVQYRRKVLAGIVMITGPQVEDLEVISVATGNRCIYGEHVFFARNFPLPALTEIIAHRCLCDFICSQLEMQTNSEKS